MIYNPNEEQQRYEQTKSYSLFELTQTHSIDITKKSME